MPEVVYIKDLVIVPGAAVVVVTLLQRAGLQVAFTAACTAALSLAFGLSPGPVVFPGFVGAVSSTAVVLRGLSRSGELEASHGRLAVGILVFRTCV